MNAQLHSVLLQLGQHKQRISLQLAHFPSSVSYVTGPYKSAGGVENGPLYKWKANWLLHQK